MYTTLLINNNILFLSLSDPFDPPYSQRIFFQRLFFLFNRCICIENAGDTHRSIEERLHAAAASIVILIDDDEFMIVIYVPCFCSVLFISQQIDPTSVGAWDVYLKKATTTKKKKNGKINAIGCHRTHPQQFSVVFNDDNNQATA